MSYRLKYWIFLRDLMCFDEYLAKVTIAKSLEYFLGQKNLPPLAYYSGPPDPNDKLLNVVRRCNCANSQEGMEACLFLNSERMSPALTSEKFDEFLKELDIRLENIMELVINRELPK